MKSRDTSKTLPTRWAPRGPAVSFARRGSLPHRRHLARAIALRRPQFGPFPPLPPYPLATRSLVAAWAWSTTLPPIGRRRLRSASDTGRSEPVRKPIASPRARARSGFLERRLRLAALSQFAALDGGWEFNSPSRFWRRRSRRRVAKRLFGCRTTRGRGVAIRE
jgi:hypothetical protein